MDFHDDVKNHIEKTISTLQPGDRTVLAKLVEKFGPENEMATVEFAIDALLAGSETTGVQSMFLLYHLARNPGTQEKLYQEICSEIGAEGHLTETSLSRMKYPKACQMEAMRVNPVTLGSLRKLDRDIILSGYQVIIDYIFVKLISVGVPKLTKKTSYFISKFRIIFEHLNA